MVYGFKNLNWGYLERFAIYDMVYDYIEVWEHFTAFSFEQILA